MGFFNSFHSDRFSTHENQCGSCGRSDVSTRNLSCYCNKYRRTFSLDESKCRDYVKDRSRDYDFWRRIYTYHISTVICKILEIDSDSIAFKSIKELKEYYELDEDKKSLLTKYDVIGPQIATCLLFDKDSQEICEDLLVNYLAPTAVFVKEGKFEEALRLYTTMVEKLYVKYVNSDIYTNMISFYQYEDKDFMTENKKLVK